MRTDVTFVVVNYKTKRLIEACYRSLCRVEPGVPIVLVDNGSHDASTDFIKAVGRENRRVQVILNGTNLTHGPALHRGIVRARTRYVFAMDSDCEARRKPFLNLMVNYLQEKRAYAIGQVLWFCRRPKGHSFKEDLFSCQAIKYGKKQYPKQELLPRIHPARMLIDRGAYLRFRPFKAAKEPELENMADAYDAGLKVFGYPVKKYVSHKGGGTRGGMTWDLSAGGERKP